MRFTIIGAGPGGYVAALKAAQFGAQVTIIEDTEVGGTCLNRGCIPAKSLVASAEAIRKAKRLGEFGIEVSGDIIPNLSKIMERKDKIVSTQVKGIRSLFKSWGINLIEGRGTLLAPRKVEVQKKDTTIKTIETDKIVIATGSRPAQLPIFPFDGEHILSSDDALNIKSIPKSLIIIGAGVIGCEFACIFKELGTEVTMIEAMPRALFTEDPEISVLLERELKKKKIKLLTNVSAEGVESQDDGIHLHLGGGKEIVAEKLLVSVGRTLNTAGIGLETLGIKKGVRGEIVVNEKMETDIEGIYAVGDVTGGMLLAHVASKEGSVAACNACEVERKMDCSVIPAAVFTSPEIGSVGLREHQAADKDIKIRTGRFQFRASGKAHTMGEIAGMVKIVADADTDKVIGMHIIGPHASDLVHEGALAIKAGVTAREIAETIHAHPTLAEGIMEAAEDLHGEAVHAPKKS
ncbi:dihydrolipoyl dehydrogenase [Thermodesulfovibrionales bacterium]|nr:dihydrolipoyl dehydrogenase [Thermodesulfovibrionales bacterium]MCL0042168.1 dihydrolipoyl dehydrogenase [Thermodesulfovibrionales bacterium]MCL0061620.1 dihydrolipoyl dehydrogenase [Thermodesulfovibrionales bacterium]MCL0083196.1 dihydrolipoyl dehydrogenase [Thermodesulfovibrionales bacterium]MCL0086102.1 dihydrolipoyl dehydrogenase [Thermodesulfovibrionales bacterium]